MKSANIYLIVVLLALVGAVIALQVTKGDKNQRNFRKELVQIDTAQVNTLYLYPQAMEGKELKLTKSNNNWTLAQEGAADQTADKAKINELLRGLSSIRPQRLAATKSEKWEEYQVNEEKGTRIKVKEADKTTLDMYVGKFAVKQNQAAMGGQPNPMQQQQPQITSYVRLASDEATYAVDGMLSFMFNRKAEDFLPPPPPEPTDSMAVDAK